MANFFDFLNYAGDQIAKRNQQPKPKKNIKAMFGMLLVICAGLVATKYKEIVAGFSADPVPFILFPVLLIGAYFVYKMVSPHLPGGGPGDPPRRDNTGSDPYEG